MGQQTTFKINDTTEIKCAWRSTRNGFCHRANLYQNGRKIDSTYCSYLNRKWERYTYESVLGKLLEKSKIVPEDQADVLLKAWGNDPNLNGMGALNSLAAVMKMGEIFFNGDQKKSNDWKARMLASGLGDAVTMPDNWNDLSEDEKERRLNGATECFSK